MARGKRLNRADFYRRTTAGIESVEFGYFMDDPSAPKLHVTVPMREVPVELIGLILGRTTREMIGANSG